jgi:hypothetical protein
LRQHTRDHEVIRAWVQERDGVPARVRAAGLRRDATSVLRVAFGSLPPTWERLDWDTFFEAFDEARLSFLYEDSPGSRIFKLTKQ